jgi:hypothetical protein
LLYASPTRSPRDFLDPGRRTPYEHTDPRGPRCIRPGKLAASLALLALAAGIGRAAEYVVAGKKLLLKTPAAGATGNRVVHLGTGAAITVGQEGSAGDPRCVVVGGGGAS